ncbi:hypothetical protein [Dehalococcoides mccartyi]|uniref:Mom family adenine methylcarbamoylation protein n=1 Tax=Dehalococcoides mccartyi TaxID=61435 RepID=UPI0003C83424|nr:hypothetical protein [Dehalococcoides mccartyi]AHB14134.1 DNA modification protein [Dehalococcoides mccartyi GY50]
MDVNCAAGVMSSMVSCRDTGVGLNPSAALHNLLVCPIPRKAAARILEREHYLHSFPAGTMLCFGVMLDNRLTGAITLGAGPALAYRLVDGAEPQDCLTLTRFWLSDDLPKNAESRVLGVIFRYLKRHTDLKFLISYSDPSAGHLGIIYQATGWLYTGLSSAMPLYDLGDGRLRHGRSLNNFLGSRDQGYLKKQGIKLNAIKQSAKHRYLYFLDPKWRGYLKSAVLPYPIKEGNNGNN